MGREEEKVVLVRIETSPEDLRGMARGAGILTTRGGMTSHAAVVARGMGKCCVSGAGEIIVDYKAKTVRMAARPTRKATGFRSTVRPATFTTVRCPADPSSTAISAQS